MAQNKLIFITIIILLLLGLNLGGFETDYQIGTELALSDNLGKDQKVPRLASQKSVINFLLAKQFIKNKNLKSLIDSSFIGKHFTKNLMIIGLNKIS